MNLDDLTREDLVLVSKMLASGMTMEEIEKVFIFSDLRCTVNNLHLLLCKKDHDSDCMFYSGDWQLPVHQEWLNFTKNVMSMFSIDTKQLDKVIWKIYDIEAIINEMEGVSNQKLIRFLLTNPTPSLPASDIDIIDPPFEPHSLPH